MSLRGRITATQLADFFDCPRKAWLTDREPSSLRDEPSGLLSRILAAGDAFEADLVSRLPGVVDLDSFKKESVAAREKETRLAMEREAAAIHHGVLTREEGGVVFLTEPDLLERVEDGYRVTEIKNSPKPKVRHAVQLALSAWILGDGRPAAFLSRRGREAFDVATSSRWIARLRALCVRLLAEDAPPPSVRRTICRGCAWETRCFTRAMEARELGVCFGVRNAERKELFSLGLADQGHFFAPEADRSPAFRDWVAKHPDALSHWKPRLEAARSGSLVRLGPPPVRRPLLLHVERDVVETKEWIAAAVYSLPQDRMVWHRGSDLLDFIKTFLRSQAPGEFYVTRRSTLGEIEDLLLRDDPEFRPEDLPEWTSLEAVATERVAFPRGGSGLRALLDETHGPSNDHEPLLAWVEGKDDGKFQESTLRFLRRCAALLSEAPGD